MAHLFVSKKHLCHLNRQKKWQKCLTSKTILFSTSANAAASTNIKPITGNSDTSSQQGFGGGRAGEEVDTSKSTVAMNPDFHITGVNNLLTLPTFEDGTAKIISGRAITEKDKNTNNVVIESYDCLSKCK